VTLVLTLVLGTVALTTLFWGLGLFVQGALYSQPADRLPVRAVVAGLLMALVLTGWTLLNTRASHKDKYGTLFEFNPTAVQDVTAFDAVRRLRVKDAAGQFKEEVVPFRFQSGTGTGAARFVDPAGQGFRRTTGDYMTVAVLVPAGDAKVRFAAAEANGVYVLTDGNAVFREENGRRTVTDENMGHMQVPSTAALVVALLVNVLHFAAWFVAFWPVMRFTVGHALGLTALFGGVTMLVLMPLLFQLNAVKAAAAG